MITISLNNPTPEEVDALRDIFSDEIPTIDSYEPTQVHVLDRLNNIESELKRLDPIEMFNKVTEVANAFEKSKQGLKTVPRKKKAKGKE